MHKYCLLLRILTTEENAPSTRQTVRHMTTQFGEASVTSRYSLDEIQKNNARLTLKIITEQLGYMFVHIRNTTENAKLQKTVFLKIFREKTMMKNSFIFALIYADCPKKFQRFTVSFNGVKS